MRAGSLLANPLSIVNRSLVFCLFLTFCVNIQTAVADSSFTLISPQEYEAVSSFSIDADQEFLEKSVPGGPIIEIISPTGKLDEVSSPLDIELKFKAVGEAEINLDSLKILYVLLLKKDVTKRILKHAEVGPDFIKAKGAELPKGKHVFILRISDNNKRVTNQKFAIEVI